MIKKADVIFRALVSIVLCVCVALLSLLAVSTEKASVNLALTAGDVHATAKVTSFRTYSSGVAQGDFDNYVSEYGGKFGSYGTATFRNNILSLNRLKVGDRVDFQVAFSQSNAQKTQYRLVLECINDKYLLYEGLTVTVRSNAMERKEFSCDYDGTNPYAVMTDWLTAEDGKVDDVFFISVSLPAESSQFEGCGTQMSVSVQVVSIPQN
jgi:hypothetical protein